MHSWFRSLILPASGITISFGSSSSTDSDQRRRSSPMTARSQNTSANAKPWSSPLFAAASLVVADQFNDASLNTTSSSNNNTARVHAAPDIIRNSGGGAVHQERESEEQRKSWGCNPLGSASCTRASHTQIVPFEGDQEEEGGVVDVEAATLDDFVVLNSGAESSPTQRAEATTREGASLRANVSSSQLEEMVVEKSRDPHAPLIILFGWAGCRDRYLSKYSAYYQNEGYAVARFTVPISKVRSFSTYRKFALEIYEKILEQEPNRPIIFHMFSMNGASLFTALWDLLDNASDGADIKKRVKGLIFDSSPANVLPHQAARAISTAMSPPGKSSAIPRELNRVALTGIFSVHRALVWLQSNFNPQSYEKHFSYFRLLRFEDLPKNQMFLYSDADNICVPESIEHFQEMQRKRQVEVKTLRWKDSEHCQHYRRYENEYIRACLEFAKASLDSKERN